MAKTVVGLFRNLQDAESVVRDLETEGFAREEISIMTSDQRGAGQERAEGKSAASGAAKGAGAGAAVGGGLGLIAGLASLAIPGFGPVIAAGPIAAALTGGAIGAAAGGLIGGLKNMGVSDEDAAYYAEGVRRGGVLVAVEADDQVAEDAADIMERHNAEDVEKRGEEWRASGWSGPAAATYDETTAGSAGSVRGHAERTRDRADYMTSGREQQESIPIVEEELRVGKRQVHRGGVRLYSRMTEHPVEEDITLREEHVDVDRRKVDRPATERDIRAFQEGTVELSETAEEPIISKTARVTEEVRLGKTVEERKETVRDKVRKTEVDVQRMAAGSSHPVTGEYDEDFRSDFNTRYANRGYTYEQYAPAYRFGSTYATDQRYANRDWSQIESDARRDWESRGEGKWEDFKDAVRHGWDKVRGRR